jgi:hypothetical protein
MKTPLLAVIALLIAMPATAQDQPTQRITRNVQLTFHLIEADGFQGDDPEIGAVVTELRKLFRFQGYRLLSKSVLHATANPASRVSQQVADDQGRAYHISAEVDQAGGDLALSVRLGLMQSGDYAGLIDASVRLQDGRTVVLGSARLSGQSGALILAVTPTIDR